jgi:hypothetical protein
VSRRVVVVVTALLAACTSAPPTPTATSAPTTSPPARTAPGHASSSALDPTTTADPAVEARRLVTDAAAAADAGPDAVRSAVATAMADDLSGLVADPWEDRVLEGLPDWPVTVGEATVGLDGRVELDVVVAAPADDDGELVLRWLPAAPALGNAVERLEVTVDGTAVEPTVDGPGARLVVPVAADTDHAVRVQAAYRVPERLRVEDDGTPAGYGLLSRTDDAVMLGHWLPLVALPSDDGPMQARGDVGAFPPGAFSVVVRHEGTVVSGGEERDCPAPAAGCTWLQGVGLRDLAAVVLAEAVTAEGQGVAVHLVPDSDAAERGDPVAQEAATVRQALARDLGDLPWPTVDVVAAPISPGALGMEFPGLVWVDPGAWPAAGPGLGSYVLAHELGHQWFHALVGNGSLSAPVVDESLAQYLSVVAFDEVFGPGSGASLADRAMAGRHAGALAEGVPDEAPAQPLADFSSAEAYGANVYGRGGQAWVTAEDAAGRDTLLAALRTLVERYGLREVDVGIVVDVVTEVAPAAATPLADGWGVGTDG